MEAGVLHYVLTSSSTLPKKISPSAHFPHGKKRNVLVTAETQNWLKRESTRFLHTRVRWSACRAVQGKQNGFACSETVVSITATDDQRGGKSTVHQRKASEACEEDRFLQLRQAFSATVAAGCIVFQASCPAWAESLTVTFPGSKLGEVTAVQKTLVEAWGIVRETYVDPAFNHQDWDLMLQETLGQTLSATSSEEVYSKIRTMLGTLGDPFTRIISPQEYQNFRINNDGALEGVGLLIASDRETGRLIVMSPIDGGPAARAGIHTGDEIVQIDGEVLAGMNGEDAAKRLRGRPGTTVTIKLRRSVSDVDEPGEPHTTEVKFELQRETVLLSPVYRTLLFHRGAEGQPVKTGYIRLSAFSQNAASEMEQAIISLKDAGAESYILDLRNNPGGLVKAGLDIAQMWLDGNEVLVNTIDRDGDTQPITLVNGHALTKDPLVLLVNEGSASASEILAGALQDNGRAILIGQNTFGKGKIQSVSELKDGSALFVTVAKYLSPDLHQIDQIGIAPDLKCSPEEITASDKALSVVNQEEDPVAGTIQRDSCVLVAEYELNKHSSS